MFQKSIIEKYLSKLDANLLHEKYKKYCANYKNETKIANIRAVKEEQYQEGFIRDVFCSVLNYTIKPEPDYNILTELKNETKNKNNARKSDGAICEENNESRVRAVIELKGTDTTDLDTVARQAFDYKSHHENCNYAIVCNFERLRLYVETQIEFIEFNLFTLTFEDFCILYLLLELNQLKNDIPLKLKHETLSEEKQITDNFYADYSTFKRLLFEDLCENNSESDKLLLFKKTQKLLDRILFILFCEDRNLLPANSVLGIIKRWEAARENFLEVPLYNLFKQYFNWIDKGFENPNDKNGSIFAYNGGLFKTDEVLDNIKVGDDVLFIHTKRLADYDFESQISVDILGRIFENSLTEIEEVQKEIEAEKTGEKVENNNVGKRKKDGVFYTPEYITKYIVENTIGKLCEEKREELKINDEEFTPEKSVKTGDDKKTVSAKQKITAELDKRLETYRAWLLDLKILDPACGSGAFLNAALQQLKIEHTLIDYYWSNIHAGELNFTEIENTILENNLYGVDINEESVEIAKLSLWLHTAKKNRKLTTLNGKIKCGNSLIDDPSVAGEKAFKWEKEFPEVFGGNSRDKGQTDNAKGGENKHGFDVIIGNPPYVNMNNIKDENLKSFYKKNYKTMKEMCDLYSLFTERAKFLLRKNGLLGFIFSNSWLGIKSFLTFREFLAKDVKVTRLVELPEKVFVDATVKTCICFYTNLKPSENDSIEICKCENELFYSKGFNLTYSEILKSENFTFSFEKSIELTKVKSHLLKNIMKSTCGIKTANDDKFISQEKKDEDSYLFLRGRNLQKWLKPENETLEYIWYKPELMKENINARPRSLENFYVDEKILIKEIGQEINATLDTDKYLCNDTVNVIYELKFPYSMKFILTLLNSKLINVWFKQKYPSGLHIKINQLETIPIPDLTDSQFSTINSQLTSLADKMLTLNETLQKKSTNFLKVVKQTFALEKISTKLETFYNLDFDGFMKELKQKLTPKTKLEWLEVFEETKKSLQKIQTQIAATDKEINALVYKLYDLTDEEIKIVEGR